MPKSISCPQCMTAINVPDSYARPGIACPGCHISVDVRTGQPAHKAAPKPMAPAGGLSLAAEEPNAPVGVAAPHL